MSLQNEDRLHLLVVGILEGRYFISRLGHLLIIEITIAGKKLITDPVPLQASPHVNTELCWQVPHMQIQQFKLHRTPLKLILFSIENRSRSREQIGYIMFDLRCAQQKTSKPQWHRLLNVSYPSMKPELLVQFSLEDCNNTYSKFVKTLPIMQTNQSDLQLRLDPKHGYFCIDSDVPDNLTDEKQLFILSFTLKALLHPYNFFSYGNTVPQAKLEIICSLFGSQVRSELFTLTLLAETDLHTPKNHALTNTFQSERTTLRISASKPRLEQLLRSYSPIVIKLMCEGVLMANGDLSLSQLASDLSSIPTQIDQQIILYPTQLNLTLRDEDYISISIVLLLKTEFLNKDHVTDENQILELPNTNHDDIVIVTPTDLIDNHYVTDSTAPTVAEQFTKSLSFSIDIISILNLALPVNSLDIDTLFYIRYTFPFLTYSSVPVELKPAIRLPLGELSSFTHSCCVFDILTSIPSLSKHLSSHPLTLELVNEAYEDVVATATFLLSEFFNPNDKLSPGCTKWQTCLILPLLSRSVAVSEVRINLTLSELKSNFDVVNNKDNTSYANFTKENEYNSTYQKITPSLIPTSPSVYSNSPYLKGQSFSSIITQRKPISGMEQNNTLTPSLHPLNALVNTDEYQQALQLEMWKDAEEHNFKNKLRRIESQLLDRLGKEWAKKEQLKCQSLEAKSLKYEEMQQEVENAFVEIQNKKAILNKKETDIERREQKLMLDQDRWTANKESTILSLSTEYEQKLVIEKEKLILNDEKLKQASKRLADSEVRLSQRQNDIDHYIEESRSKPETHLQLELSALMLDKNSLKIHLTQALQAKQQYRLQWGRALQELARLRQEEYASSQLHLKQEQEELEQLRSVYLHKHPTSISHRNFNDSNINCSINKRQHEALETLSTQLYSSTLRGNIELNISRLVHQKNLLLETGVYNAEDPIICRLDASINEALNSKIL